MGLLPKSGIRFGLCVALGTLGLLSASADLRADAPPTDLNVVQQPPVAAAADSTPVASTGAFNEPTLVPVKRPEFGLKAARPAAIEPIKFEPPAQNTSVMGFGAATGVALLITILVCFTLSKMVDSTGASRRAITVGLKLAMAFGTLTTLMLGMATMSAKTTRDVESISSELSNLIEKERTLVELKNQVSAIRITANRFIVRPSDDNLVKFTEGMAKFTEVANQIKTMTDDQQVLAIASAVAEDVAQYDVAFAKVVGEIDSRDAIVESQLNVVAARVANTLDAAAKQASKSGDAQLVLQITGALMEFQTARLNAMKFIATEDEKHVASASLAMQNAQRELEKLPNLAKSQTLKSQFAECAAAAGYYANRVNAILASTKERDKAIEQGMNLIGPSVAAKSKELETLVAGRAEDLREKAAAASFRADVQSALLAAFAVGVAVIVGFMLVRNISGSIRKVLSVLQSVANNDLMQQPINLTSKDELGELARATDKMAASLRDVITEVSISTTEVSSAATEIAASAEEMSASVGEVARQCAQAAESAGSAGKMASEGGKVVRQTVTGMQEIDSAVQASAQSVATLGERGQQIGQVIKVINDIADQTNLLALNAAIEAARAGEHGRGFAVVADEVRKLAERTTKATEEVASSIKSIQEETRQAVNRMGKGTEQVKQGVQLAEQCGENLNQIVEGSTGVAGMIQSISSAAEEAGAGATQSASAAVQLSAKAEQLMAMVGRFKLDTGSYMKNAVSGSGKNKKKAAAHHN